MASRLRRHDRTPLNANIRLSWEDGSGSVSETSGVCKDVSAEGLRVLVNHKVPERARVTFHVNSPRIVASGTVRYCIASRIRYLIGIEFIGGFKWPDPPQPPLS